MGVFASRLSVRLVPLFESGRRRRARKAGKLRRSVRRRRDEVREGRVLVQYDVTRRFGHRDVAADEAALVLAHVLVEQSPQPLLLLLQLVLLVLEVLVPAAQYLRLPLQLVGEQPPPVAALGGGDLVPLPPHPPLPRLRRGQLRELMGELKIFKAFAIKLAML